MYSGLIVGLGNPGTQYALTRHNMGFLFLDELIARTQASSLGSKFKGEIFKTQIQGENWLLAKPMTFMNLSGECVQPLAAWHKLLPQQILVIHDELDIPAGQLRFKVGGGNAGHNGLKSITERLGTPDFYRLRIGIDRSPFADTLNWVLGKLTAPELETFRQTVPAALETLDLFCKNKMKEATTFAAKVGKIAKVAE